MILAKRRASLEPIRRHHTKASSYSIGNIQRTASSRPVTDNKSKPPSALANLLPLIKPPTNNKKQLRPLQLHKIQKNPPKLTLDEQILSSRRQHIRGKSKGSHKQGLDTQTLLQRKESHLNTYYNQRKQKLVQLTRANRRLYDRINSQTSLYSSRDLDRSFESSHSLSRRLSLSKLSKLSSRHSIQNLTHSRRTKEEKANPQPVKRKSIKIEPEDINTVEVGKMYRYLSIFCNHLNLVQTKTEKAKPQLPPSIKSGNKENNQTLHGGQLSKIHEENNQRITRRTKLQLARRH